MQKPHISVEFEGRIDSEGRIMIPVNLRELLQTEDGEKFHVRLTSSGLNLALKKKNVSEGEIARISDLQLESRDQVVRFLLSEGALKNHRRHPARSSGRAHK